MAFFSLFLYHCALLAHKSVAKPTRQLSVCLCHPHPLLSIPLSLFNLEEQHLKQLLPLSQLSGIHRHKGQEGQLQPSALTSCLTQAREFHPVIPASSLYLLFQLESTM